MKLLASIACCLFNMLSIYAQNSISGLVRDKNTNELLPGAHIYIPDLQKGTSTNAQGFYKIGDLPKNTFLVEVSFLSYSTEVREVSISGETTLNILLEPSVTEMSEVVVTGTSASTEREINPVPTIVINTLSLNESSSTNIIDAISSQPGISQITTGSAVSKPVIRGLGYNRVVVLNNNIRQEGQQWGDEHGIEIDEYSVDRIEIIKGPGSIMYGSDAMAGVIHFLAPKPVEEGKIIGNIVSNYQTNNNLIGYSIMNAGNLKSINWLARLSSKIVGNYNNRYDGKVYNSGFNELNVNGSLGINKKWGYSQLHFTRFNQSLGLVEGERDTNGKFIRQTVINDSTTEEQTLSNGDLNSYQIDVPKQGISHLKVSSTSKFYLNRMVLSSNFAFQQNQRKEFANPLNTTEEELYFLLNTFNYDVKLLLPEKNNWKSSFGINGMQQSSINKGEEFLIPEYNLIDGGIFAFSQKKMGKLYVSGGLRYDVRSVNSQELYLNPLGEKSKVTDSASIIKFAPFNTTFSTFSGSVGTSYRLSEMLTGKMNISRGFRSPNMAELGSNGEHEGTFRYEVGNTQLKQETSLQIDAGVLLNSEHLSIELATYNNNIHNYIFLQKLNSVYGGDSIIASLDSISVYQFTQGNANLYGGELAIDIHPHPLDWLHFENSLSLVRGRLNEQSDSTKYLPFIPAPKVQSVIRANFKKVGNYFHNLYIRADVVFVFQQSQVYSAYGTETPTMGYTLANAGIGTDILNTKGNTLFSLSLTVNNLFDVAYQNHMSRLKYAPENIATGRVGVFNMGRNFSIKMIAPLVFKKPI